MSELHFSQRAWNDYLYWQSQDRKTLKRINAIIRDLQRNPYEGVGKPEPLKEDLSGWWADGSTTSIAWSTGKRTAR